MTCKCWTILSCLRGARALWGGSFFVQVWQLRRKIGHKLMIILSPGLTNLDLKLLIFCPNLWNLDTSEHPHPWWSGLGWRWRWGWWWRSWRWSWLIRRMKTIAFKEGRGRVCWCWDHRHFRGPGGGRGRKIEIRGGNVTPWSHGYGDITATYIRRSKIPLRIYAKHQYRRESECESTVVIYIPTEIAQVHGYHREWYNITGNYITRKIQEYIIWRDTRAERCSRAARGVSRTKQERNWEEELQWWSKLMLHSDHHGRIRCILCSATARPPRSGL